jgi:hypothetical protein
MKYVIEYTACLYVDAEDQQEALDKAQDMDDQIELELESVHPEYD